MEIPQRKMGGCLKEYDHSEMQTSASRRADKYVPGEAAEASQLPALPLLSGIEGVSFQE